MIVDIHTHVFPPEVRHDRDAYLARDAAFRAVHGTGDVPIATAEELLASMDAAGVDTSVVLGFPWSDGELCRWHSQYLLEASAASGGRLVPFATINPADDGARAELKRLAARGARGLGELRPPQQGYKLIDSEEADLLAWGAEAYDLALLFHADAPVGPAGGAERLPVEQLWRFIGDFPGVSVIAAHWGGGLPFYALMPEVREALASAYFDTASAGVRYRPEAYEQAARLVGAGRLLFGSGYPRRPQAEALRELDASGLDDEAKRLVMGENARKLLRL